MDNILVSLLTELKGIPGALEAWFASLTMPGWLNLSGLVQALAPEEAALLKGIAAIDAIVAGWAANLDAAAVALAARNTVQYIDGYDANGAVVQILNPDYKG
jgi:hypothetical protein